MSETGSTVASAKRIIECPACSGQLRVPATDDYLRLRCPHCGRHFALGIPDAEVVDTSVPDAEIVAPPPAATGVAHGAPSSAAPAAHAAGGGLGRLLGWAVGLGVAGVVLSAVAWFLVPKREVLVIDRNNGQPAIVAQYHYLPEAFLAGAPAAVMRWAGMQPPARIETPSGAVELSAFAVDDPVNRLIVINRGPADLHYMPSVYGDLDSLPKGARIEPLRIAPGTGALVLAKTHGDYRFGCGQRPADSEVFSTRTGDAIRYTVLGWFVEGTPESCGDG